MAMIIGGAALGEMVIPLIEGQVKDFLISLSFCDCRIK